MKRTVFLFLCWVLAVLPVHSQGLPPSPDVISALKGGSLYSGSVPASISLAQLQSRSLGTSISLNNSCSGIKVAERASMVGLGWSLNYGGMITRTVKGLPDDDDAGYLYEASGLPSPYNDPPPDYLDLEDYHKNDKDGEADMFHFSFNGRSGSFFFDRNKNCLLSPDQDLDIDVTYNGFSINKFVITDEYGIKYTFSVKETVSAEIIKDCWTIGPKAIDAYTSSWYLRKIESADGNDQIFFDYNTISYQTEMQVSQTEYIFNEESGGNNCTDNIIQTIFYESSPQINKIYSDHFEVRFTYGQNRCDIQPMTGQSSPPYLERIKLYNKKNGSAGFLKEFVLGYSYASSSTDGISVTSCSSYQSDYRLILESVEEKNGSTSAGSYTFDYHWDAHLPGYDSKSIDHWGYFNGASNTSLIPNNIPYDNYNDNTQYFHGGANRGTGALNYTKAGSLEKITYPSGGIKTFDYERKKYREDNTDKTGGGIRVSQIDVNDGQGNTTTITYDYKVPDQSYSSGKIGSPVFYKAQDTRVSGKDYIVISGNTAYPMTTLHGSYVIYEYVSVTNGATGKTIYEYKIPSGCVDFYEAYETSSPAGYGWLTTCYVDDITNLNMHHAYNEQYKYGYLESQLILNQSGDKISYTTYNYGEEDRSEFDLSTNNTLCFPEGGFIDGITYRYYRNRVFPQMKLQSQTETVYNPDNETQKTVKSTVYHYDSQNHYFNTGVETDDGEGGKTFVKTKYMGDYSNSATDCDQNNTALNFKNRNMIGFPVEKQVWKKEPSAASYYLVSGTIKTYCETAVDFNPHKKYELETDAPLSSTSFNESSAYGGNFGNFISDPEYYREVEEYSYDNDGNLVEIKPVHGEPSSIIYGYNNSLPVARVGNAGNGEALHDGFENENMVSWLNFSCSNSDWNYSTSDPKSGKYSVKFLDENDYRGFHYVFDIDDLDLTRKYTFSTWVKAISGTGSHNPRILMYIKYNNGSSTSYTGGPYASGTGDWEYLESEIDFSQYSDITYYKIYLLNGPYSSSGSGPYKAVYFDEMRFFPADAQMTTTTYEPMIGVTSQTGINGRTTYKQYDPLGRILRVLDNDKNVLKEYNYHINP